MHLIVWQPPLGSLYPAVVCHMFLGVMLQPLVHKRLVIGCWFAEVDPEYIFTFPDPGTAGVSPPILGFHDVDFNYPGGPTLFKNLNFGMVGGVWWGGVMAHYKIGDSSCQQLVRCTDWCAVDKRVTGIAGG
jgi:hypothetical protein